jgi:hypothetical protein
MRGHTCSRVFDRSTIGLITVAVVLVTASRVSADARVITATPSEIVVDYRFGVFETFPTGGKALDKATMVAREHCAKYDSDVIFDAQLSFEKNRNVFRFKCVARDAAAVEIERFAQKYNIEPRLTAGQLDALRSLERDWSEAYLLMIVEGLGLVPGQESGSAARFRLFMRTGHQVAQGVNLSPAITGTTPRERIRTYVALMNETRARHGGYSDDAVLEVIDRVTAAPVQLRPLERRRLRPVSN